MKAMEVVRETMTAAKMKMPLLSKLVYLYHHEGAQVPRGTAVERAERMNVTRIQCT